MLDELNAAINNNELNIKDINCLKELLTVFVEDGGKVNISGKDRVAATAIAWQMRKYFKPATTFKSRVTITGKR
jgi:hypothetical protein